MSKILSTLLTAVVFTALSIISITTPASAASSLDAVEWTTQDLIISNEYCEPRDYTNTWYEAAQNNMMNRIDHTETMAALDVAISSGSYAVIDRPEGYGFEVLYSSNPNAKLFLYEDNGMPMYRFSDGFSTKFMVLIKGSYLATDDCTFGYVQWYQYDINHSYAPEYSKILTNTYPVVYPEGYEGQLIPKRPSPIVEPPVKEEPYDPGPPAPITRTYNGTVDCGYKDLHGMAIVQDGVESAVTLYNWESQYRASWQHNLVVGVPYQVIVTCGGSLTYSNGSVDPDIASGDWMCKPGSTPWRSKTKVPLLPIGFQSKMMLRIPGYCVLS